MTTRSDNRHILTLCLLIAATMLGSFIHTGHPVLGVRAAQAAGFTCTGTRFFESAGVNTVFEVGDTWQGGTFTYIESGNIVRVRDPETGVIVGSFPQGAVLGDEATIVFNRMIRIVGIFWFDNDPNPGEAGWSFNGIKGPLTGNRGAIWTPVDLVTNTVNINAGGDSGGVDFCFEEVVKFQGCSPGYWRTHLAAWTPTGYSPNQTLESVFDVPNSLGLDNKTLREAVMFTGGSGTVGAAKILLRAAVPALLNAAHPSVAYPRSTTNVISAVNAALASNNRNTMLSLASQLDKDNNLGCPLN